MEYIKYIAFAISIILLLIENFTKTKKDETSPFKSANILGRVLIIATILSFSVGILQTIMEDIETDKKEAIAEQRKINDSILLLRRWEYDTIKFNALLDSSRILISNSLKSIEKSNINIEKSDNIIKTSIESLNYSTGANSFPLLKFPVIADNAIAKVENTGKYPIYDLSFKFDDVDLVNKRDLKLYWEYLENQKEVRIGNLGAKLAYQQTMDVSFKAPERNFKITFYTRNGSYLQWMKYRNKNGIIYFANKVEKLHPKRETIFQQIDKGFLDDNEKSIPWTDYYFNSSN